MNQVWYDVLGTEITQAWSLFSKKSHLGRARQKFICEHVKSGNKTIWRVGP